MRDTVYRQNLTIGYGYLGRQNFNNHDNYVTVYRISHHGSKTFIFYKFMFNLILLEVAGCGSL